MDIAEYKRAFLVNSELSTSEEPPDNSNGITWYTCDYLFASSHQTKSGNLLVFASPGEKSVKASLKISAESCLDKPTYLSENAFYCTENDDQFKNTRLVVTRISRGQMRTAMVTAGPPPDFAHPDAYAALEKTLLDRL
ncbi:hypothetical protein [Amycolatopsis sp. FDAARGOS 1241]|uniref:hypothetical protein n=1 Tax=Amycolatopsis sp. FDAARGOS 1241 TaxID=2778070 RepID=UPI00194DD714|nr:hypothetical protein [Amycolatopsis sp. FDAARGOS 1241]QRP49014.1 hypothetical protein I6J71_15155 [Amycolatopsis sp. FDAARGOS 1241]